VSRWSVSASGRLPNETKRTTDVEERNSEEENFVGDPRRNGGHSGR
jgi:hypothetical protein